MEGAVLRTPSPLASTGTSGSVGPGLSVLPSKLPGLPGLGAVPGRRQLQRCNHSGKPDFLCGRGPAGWRRRRGEEPKWEGGPHRGHQEPARRLRRQEVPQGYTGWLGLRRSERGGGLTPRYSGYPGQLLLAAASARQSAPETPVTAPSPFPSWGLGRRLRPTPTPRRAARQRSSGHLGAGPAP